MVIGGNNGASLASAERYGVARLFADGFDGSP
jgi:hypothetical protein